MLGRLCRSLMARPMPGRLRRAAMLIRIRRATCAGPLTLRLVPGRLRRAATLIRLLVSAVMVVPSRDPPGYRDDYAGCSPGFAGPGRGRVLRPPAGPAWAPAVFAGLSRDASSSGHLRDPRLGPLVLVGRGRTLWSPAGDAATDRELLLLAWRDDATAAVVDWSSAPGLAPAAGDDARPYTRIRRKRTRADE